MCIEIDDFWTKSGAEREGNGAGSRIKILNLDWGGGVTGSEQAES